MNEVYLLVGGNIGDRKHYLAKAANFIQNNCGTITNKSALFETEPWGMEDQAPFLNQALGLETTLNPMQLLDALLELERQEGRKRAIKYGPRTLDIDILLFNNDIIQMEGLTIPHPQMANRRFVLQPLSEIAGSKIHPVLHRSILQLLASCPDPLKVIKIE